MSSLISRITLGLGLALSLAIAPLAQAANPAYDVVEPVQPSDTPGKIEILEFFAYTCPHCKAIEPLVEKWVPTLPEQVVFKSVPVAFNASMQDLQKLYYTLEALDRLDLHPAVFAAIHDEGQRLFKADEITDWVAKQGVDRQAFLDTFNSFGITTRVSRANELAKAYHIDGTPSFAIGGQYVTSPSHTGTYQGAIDEADKLVKQILAKGQ
ncbi:MAG TPA: thiol:disulfide interchange protein DsbA/DsbL [Castellaniella sp.]|nr:thiol:disulfide interchange protein DsbA/DsbL [Castellaniella sp.]